MAAAKTKPSDTFETAWNARFASSRSFRSVPRVDEDSPASTDTASLTSTPKQLAAGGGCQSGISLRLNLVLTRCPAPDVSTPLSAPARRVLGLVDDRATVREIVDGSGLADDVAHEILYALVEIGLLRPIEA